MSIDVQMSTAESAAAPLPAVARVVALESFDSWASRHRRRAALDGAWRVEVSERVLRGAVTRSVTTWHDCAPQPPLPPRQDQQRRRTVHPQQKQPSRRGMGTQTPRQSNAKQQRSAARSALRHKQIRARALRRVLHVALFATRLWRAMMATLALRNVPMDASPASPGKRRLSTEPLDGEAAPAVDDAASPPQPKRAAASAPPSAGLRQGFLLR